MADLDYANKMEKWDDKFGTMKKHENLDLMYGL